MKREYYNKRSEVLGEDMSMIVYGEGGYPVIAFQAQDAKSNNFEDFGMIDVLAPYIDAGRIQVFSVDNLDEESWSDEGGDKAARAARQEDYFRFVTDELIPRVHAWNNSDLRPIAVGCSMGATHAAIAALRRPDLFQGCIALSGVYRTSFFFGDWMNGDLYNNDVPAFLANMPTDHPYVNLYNQRQLVLCVGQGAWEEGVDDLRFIDEQLNRLGVNHWCDFWGYDVNHDWPWWRKQMPYFMDEVLRDIESQQVEAAPAEVAAPVPEVEAEAKPAAPAKKAPAKRTTTRKAATTKPAAAKTTAAKKATTTKAAEAKAEEPKTEETKTEAVVEEAPAAKATAKKAPAKRTTTRKAATTKAAATKTAAAAKAEEPKAEADVEAKVIEETATEEKPATTAKKAPAKRTTTRKATTAKATTAAKKTTTASKTTTAKAAPKKTTTRRTTKKADAAE